MDFSRFALCVARRQEAVGPLGQMSSRRGRTQAQHASGGREAPWIRAVLGTLSTVQELSADQPPLRHPQETCKGPRRPAPEQASRLRALAAAALSLSCVLRCSCLCFSPCVVWWLRAPCVVLGWGWDGRREGVFQHQREEGAGSLKLT